MGRGRERGNRGGRRVFDSSKILEHLKENDPNGTANIIHMSEYFYFRNHLCITFELLSINLYEFIKANKFQVTKKMRRGWGRGDEMLIIFLGL